MRTSQQLKVWSFAAAAMLAIGASSAGAQSMTISNASGAQGDVATVTATLATGEASIAGTENVIQFPAGKEVAVQALANGRPNCTRNEEIDKGGTAFSFQPSGCTVGTDCTGVKALVLSLENVTPIPDGSVLYSCLVAIAESAPNGAYELSNVDVLGSDPDGNEVAVEGIDGIVTVEGVVPTDAEIVISSATAGQGGNATVSATLNTGVEVAGTENIISFTPEAAIRATEQGRPMCARNEAIDKGGTAFSFQPSGCSVGSTCTAVKALVLSLENVAPIPDGSVLYTCDIAVATDAEPGDYPLTCSGALSSDPEGGEVATSCVDGTITVTGGEVPTETPTPTVSPDVTPTNTAGQATPTRSVVPPVTNCDDGCQIVAPASSQAGWLLLLPAAMLIWVRRRSR
ncbi:MAG: hypothetical protein ACRERC_11030 [Candidatus Binatia bacterium]